MKRTTRTLATLIKNPNIKSRKDEGTRRNLSVRDLWKIRRGSCIQHKQHQCFHFYKGWSHIKIEIGPIQRAEWDSTDHKTYSKASTELNFTKKMIGLGTGVLESRILTSAIYEWRRATLDWQHVDQSLEPKWNSDTIQILSPTGRSRHNVLIWNH